MAKPPISIDVVEKAFQIWSQDQNTAKTARECNIAQATVRKYVKVGDPERGIEPFRQRLRRVVRLSARRTERKVVYSRANAHTLAWRHLELLGDIIEDYALALREKLNADEGEVKVSLAELSKAVNTHALLLAQLERTTVEQTESVDLVAFDGWTDEQIAEFARTGSLPQRRQGEAPSAEAPPLVRRPSAGQGELVEAEAAELGRAVRVTPGDEAGADD